MRNEIVYAEGESPPADTYFALFETTGWNDLYRQTPEDLAEAVRNSWYVISVYHDDDLVGVGRLLSDGVQYAVVFDMIVHPSFQGRGIGSEILRRLLEHCNAAGIRDVLLFAAKDTCDFYRRHGFEPRPSDAPGMIRRRARR